MRKSLITAVSLYIFDALILGQGIIAVIIILIVIPVLLVKMLLGKNDSTPRIWQLVKITVYLLTAILIIATIIANNELAEKRANLLIAACENYKLARRNYPDELSDLVPNFIHKIPAAKYTLAFNSFLYSSRNGYRLMYTVIPPFERKVYSFESKKWIHLD